MNEDVTLKELREQLSADLKAGKIVTCACCEQKCKVYKRTITRTMAIALLLFTRYTRPGEPFHLPTLLSDPPGDLPATLRAGFHGGDPVKLKYWGMIESASKEKRPDGSKRNGWYVVTPFGRSFARGEVFAKKHVRTYNERVLRMEEPLIKISTALGEGFDFNELMSA
jgi:hypothetical protein